MGGGRETATDRNKEDLITIFPSEIHTFAYCPRKYFFSIHIPYKHPLSARVRMFMGTIFHLIKGFFSKRKGYSVEEKIEYRVGNVKLRGRPDAYRVTGNSIEIIERKSGKGPRKGVWLSDSLQATAYGLMLRRNNERVVLRIEYRTAKRISELDSEKIGLLFRVIDDIVLVKKYGIVPYGDRRPAKCSKCPFKELCEALERFEQDIGIENMYQPGEYIKEKRIDLSFAYG
ncbi:MAG: CRISPR-associated protein Cas4 [Desulfurococcales archaeon]|nr:CRISPR-associated protein Cas4 [Desulfurococcales archaeon]